MKPLTIKQKTLLTANKLLMTAPFLSYFTKIKYRKIIISALKKSGFVGV